MTKEKQNDAMPSKGVRLRVDQWEDCDRFSETLKMASRNDFIRDAIDFYLEYLRRNNSVKFLTPALESVISVQNQFCYKNHQTAFQAGGRSESARARGCGLL